jgi:hypothetical protein
VKRRGGRVWGFVNLRKNLESILGKEIATPHRPPLTIAACYYTMIILYPLPFSRYTIKTYSEQLIERSTCLEGP